VSFLAGLLVDKFLYHCPLYRQHQRLEDGGIRVTRPWLTQLTQQSIALLEPIYEAQLASVRGSRVGCNDFDGDRTSGIVRSVVRFVPTPLSAQGVMGGR